MKSVSLLVAALLVAGIATVFSSPHDSENAKEKRQVFDLSTRTGPNNEVILVCEGEDVVYLTGNNARRVSVAVGQTVDGLGLPDVTISMNNMVLQTITNINEYSAKQCNPLSEDSVQGPGTLFVSDREAFYINDGCTFEMNFINQAITTAPTPRVTFEVEAAIDAGDPVSSLNVNSGEFGLMITGATVIPVGTAQSVSYAGDTLSTPQGSFSGINQFAVADRGFDGNAQFNVFSNSPPINVQGPGQVFVGDDKAIFIGEFGSGTTSPTANINVEVVTMTFTFSGVSGTDRTMVADNQNNPITILSGDTMSFELSGASTSTYSGTDLSITSSGGRVVNFNDITQYTVFDNNEVSINPMTFSYSAGGTVIVDSIENTAVFLSDSNQAAADIFQGFIPGAQMVSYRVETNDDDVRNLVRITGSPPDTEQETIQTITGSYVMSVDSSETVTYGDNEIQIQNFGGTPRVRIGEVDQLFTNTASNPSGTFVTSSATPFQGPGTVSYSRGTGFYTTDSVFGNNIGYQSSTAPIPDIEFEVMPLDTTMVDGENFTRSLVTQNIGGDRVISYEAVSYTTSPDEEILYANNMVTVHQPMFTGSGSVTYDGATQVVMYTDRNGNPRTLEGVSTFNQFSGGDITTTMSPDNAQDEGPGKLYVTEDRATVTFSTSDIITPEITAQIRGTPKVFMVDADQFSSIYNGVFNISTETATVTYPGGGVIWSSRFNNTDYGLYVDDEGVSDRIEQAVSSLLVTTKSVPAKESGILRIIFNGREIYSYSPTTGSNDIYIGRGSTFDFVNMMLSGSPLTGGPYTGISMVTVFDGVEVKQVNSSTIPQTFEGPGLLLLQEGSDKAFYTTNSPAISYLTASIANLRRFLVSPQIRPGKGRETTKDREITVDFGRDVTVYEGADVTFECNVIAGRPEPTVGFYRILANGDSIKLNDTVGEISVGEKTLTLLNVQMDDVGEYVCVASNGVPLPATASSTLQTVRQAVAPVLQPGWFPFRPTSGQKLIFPDLPAPIETVNLREFEQLVLACRMDGRPKVEIAWRINDQPIGVALPRGGYRILEPVQGRSVLVLDLLNTFNETFVNELLGANTIQCIGTNLAGTAEGRVELQGEITDCGTLAGGVCSTTCGFGIRDVLFTCTRYNPEPSPIDISEVPLSIIPIIERTEVCTTSDASDNVVICPVIEYRWNVSDWSECSRTCNGGLRTRKVSCLEEKFPINSRYVAQIDNTEFTVLETTTMCLMSEKAGPKPTEQEACETQSCPYYKLSAFGKCSATCGGGVRQRTVRCVVLENKYKDMNGITQFNLTDVTITQCGGAPPSETEVCNTFDCFYRWVPGAFGQCGNTSLLGPPVSSEFSCKERPVYCVNDMDVQVNDSFCDPVIKPSTLASCGHKNCFVGRWENTFFSQCSETCGYGVQTRELVCLSPETNTRVPIYFCDVSSKPIIERPCFVRNCENMCLRDENRVVCSVLANMDLCNSPYAMANNGTRCCASCGTGMPGTGTD